jgi:Hypothetical protein (DUF2513)
MAMKRDMDLARSILLKLEESKDATGQQGVDVAIEGHFPAEVAYHVMLLSEAGLVEADDNLDFEGPDWTARRLTWAGHEFLETSRVESLWTKAKEVVMEKTGGLSFDVLKAILAQLAVAAATGSSN